MKKLAILTLLLFNTLAYGQQVPPQGINFQAVLFDEFGTPVPSINENSTLNNQYAQATFTFYNFSTGLNYYTETHDISTDEFGRFQVILGRGTPIGSNTFQDIQWADGNIFLDFEVALNGQANRLVSSQELLSVPYALFAGGIQGASDLDPDPANEIQELAIDADSIYISKGNAIPIPLDGDKSSSNELQSLSVVGNQIAISNGNTVSLPAVQDPSPTNELQTLSIQGDSLTITNGNTVTIPGSLDNDSTNELQDLLITSGGYLKLSNSQDSVLIQDNSPTGGPAGFVAGGFENQSDFCWQGNAEFIDLETLYGLISAGSGYVYPLAVFDSVGYFNLYDASTSTGYMVRYELYSKAYTSFSYQGELGVQNDSIAYIKTPFGSGIYNENGIIDSISSGHTNTYPAVFPNGNAQWIVGTTSYYYNLSTGTLSTTSVTIPSSNGYYTIAVGQDSIVWYNKLFNAQSMVSLKTYSNYPASFTQSQFTTFSGSDYIYFEKTHPTFSPNQYAIFQIDLSGNNERQVTNWNRPPLSMRGNPSAISIEGRLLVEVPGGADINGLLANKINPNIITSSTINYFEEIAVLDPNDAWLGRIVTNRSPSPNWLHSSGKYTVAGLTGSYNCVKNTAYFGRGIVRWSRL